MKLRLSGSQIDGLALQVQRDWQDAHTANAARIARDERYMKLFENLPDPVGDDMTGYRVPLVTETIFAQIARLVSSIIDPRRSVRGVPIGESDGKQARRAGSFTDWAFFTNIDPTRELAKGLIREQINGRAFWYVPWEQEFDLEGNQIWEGHRFISVGPGDLFHSSEPGRESIQQFEWVCMRYYETRRSLMEAIRGGKEYPLFTLKDLEEIGNRTARWNEENNLNRMEDEAEGVDRETHESTGYDSDRPVARGVIPMLMWFGWIEIGGKFHHVRIRKPDANDSKIASIDLLQDLYPRMNNPRPFLETAALSHGGYYPKSTAGWLEPQEAQLTAMFRDFHKGGRRAASPPILADRETADELAQSAHDPNDVRVVRDPSKAVQLKIAYDPTFYQIGSTTVRADRDRIVGYTDFQNGRDISSPTAPKTASGTIALLQESNQRTGLNTELLERDMAGWFKHIWQLWCSMADPNVIFRVTEQYADIADANGYAKMFEQEDERAGRYDFTLEFAKGPMEENAAKEDVLNGYQLAVQNPLIVNNPRALHRLTTSMLRVLGLTEVALEMVEPPDDVPIPPDRENSMMLQGQEPKVKVNDDHDLHKKAHIRLIEWQRKSPRPDQQAIQLAVKHIAEHDRLKREQMVMQAAITGAVDNLRAMDQGLQMPVAPLPIEQVLTGAVSGQMAQGAQELPGAGR